jgi:iron complex outermembrane receptor protein
VQNAYGENGETPLNTMTSNTRYADLKGRVYGVSTQFSYLTGKQDPSVGFTGSTFDFSTLDASAEYEIRLQKLSLKPGLQLPPRPLQRHPLLGCDRDEGIFSGRYEVVTHAASLRSEYSLWDEKLRLVGGLRLDKFNYPQQVVCLLPTGRYRKTRGRPPAAGGVFAGLPVAVHLRQLH